MHTPHVPVERLKAFMLGEIQLDEHEHAHVIRCSDCAIRMAESVVDEIKNEDSEDAG